MTITLVSHALCPDVQRIAIALAEKGLAHECITVDLDNKPGWFLAISPPGRTPVLKVGAAALFESVAILEYLEDIYAPALHPEESAERARHRAWVRLGAERLSDIAEFYSAIDAEALGSKAAALNARFRRVEDNLGQGPWFAGERLSLVDTGVAPVFRYFDTFDRIGDFGIFDGLAKVHDWRAALARRPSVRGSVTPDHGDRLIAFLKRRGGGLAGLLEAEAPEPLPPGRPQSSVA